MDPLASIPFRKIQFLPRDWPVAELWQVLTGEVAGRTANDELTIFDSVGFAIEDFTTLKFLYDSTTGTDYYETIDLIAEPTDPMTRYFSPDSRDVSRRISDAHST